jgi:hypothetical protein
MTGPDLIRSLVESGLSDSRERRTAAIRAFLQEQFTLDQEVKFKQVDLQNNLLDLFIDVPITSPHRFAEKKTQFLFHTAGGCISKYWRHERDEIRGRDRSEGGRGSDGEQGNKKRRRGERESNNRCA